MIRALPSGDNRDAFLDCLEGRRLTRALSIELLQDSEQYF